MCTLILNFFSSAAVRVSDLPMTGTMFTRWWSCFINSMSRGFKLNMEGRESQSVIKLKGVSNSRRTHGRWGWWNRDNSVHGGPQCSFCSDLTHHGSIGRTYHSHSRWWPASCTQSVCVCVWYCNWALGYILLIDDRVFPSTDYNIVRTTACCQRHLRSQVCRPLSVSASHLSPQCPLW